MKPAAATQPKPVIHTEKQKSKSPVEKTRLYDPNWG